MLLTNLSAWGVQIRRSGRQLDRFHPRGLQCPQELRREQRIPVVNQVAFSGKNSRLRIGEIPRDLAHPQSVRFRRDARDCNLAGR